MKRIYNANRAGHTVRWTRWQLACCQFASGKRRVFPVSAGLRQTLSGDCASWTRTDTSDADGQIVEERPVTFTQSNWRWHWILSVAISNRSHDVFSTEIPRQKTVRICASGHEVPREARPITVYELLFIRHEAMSWSWKFTAQKALISAPS